MVFGGGIFSFPSLKFESFIQSHEMVEVLRTDRLEVQIHPRYLVRTSSAVQSNRMADSAWSGIPVQHCRESVPRFCLPRR